MKIKFERHHLDAFARLSQDYNPFHCDDAFASLTPWGQVSLHGMAVVLRALGVWAEGRAFRLRHFAAEFKKPVGLGRELDLVFSTKGDDAVVIEVRRGPTIHARVEFSWENARGGDGPAIAFTPEPVSISRDCDHLDGIQVDTSYRVLSEGLHTNLAPFDLTADQLPRHQLNALCGISYLAGMEVPGRHALLSEVSFTFADTPAPMENYRFRTTTAFDSRFNLVMLASAPGDAEQFTASAFFLPPPVTYDLSSIRAVVGRSSHLAGKVAFISGSGRGFGAVLAKAMALQGARVVVHFHSHEATARRTFDEVSSAQPESMLVRGDLTDPTETARVREQVAARFGKIDILVHNAIGTIYENNFLSQTPAELTNFVSRTVAMVANACHECLPILRDGGKMIFLSSVYTQKPKAGFSH